MKKANASAKTCSRSQRAARTSLHAACCIIAAVAVSQSPISWADTSFDVHEGETRTEQGRFILGDGETLTAQVSGSWRIASDLILGENGGQGDLRIPGGFVYSGALYVGRHGSGILDIRDGAWVSSGDVEVGYALAATGTVMVSEVPRVPARANYPPVGYLRSDWDTKDLTVGRDGAGSLTITNLGQVSSTDARVGAGAGSGVVEVGNYGKWHCDGDLDVGPGDAGTGSGSVTISDTGAIYVNGALRLNRNGSLTLDKGGRLSVDQLLINGGTFNWRGGTLWTDGEVTTDIDVTSQRRLGGYGTIHGNVINRGKVYGSLRIEGDYTQKAGSVLFVSKGGRSLPGGSSEYHFDRLSVSGHARIDGGWVNPSEVRQDQGLDRRYSILSAEGGLSGRFDGVIQPAVAKFDLAYGPTDAYLIFRGRNTYASQAATGNQRAIASYLDTIGMSADRDDVSQVLSDLDLRAVGELRQAFEAMNPAIFDAFTSVSFDSTAAYLSATSRGFHHLNLSPSAAPSAAPMAFEDLSPQASSGEPLHLSINPPAGPAADRNLTLWAGGISHWSGQDNSPQARGDDVFTSGVAVGGDYRISPSTSVGLSLGYTHSDIDWQEDAATGNGQTGYGSLYGNWADNGFWADTIVGMGLSWYDATRNIPTFGRSADSDFTAQEYFARLDGGYDWKIGRWTAGPIGSLQYINSQQGSFSETGADSLDLTVGDRDASSLQSGLGLRAGYMIDVGTTRLTPSVRAQWVHEYFNDERAIDASIAGAGDAEFRVHGNAPTRDSALLGVGLDASVTQRVSLYLDFESLLPLDGEQLTTYSLVGGLRWQF